MLITRLDWLLRTTTGTAPPSSGRTSTTTEPPVSTSPTPRAGTLRDGAHAFASELDKVWTVTIEQPGWCRSN